MRSSRVNGPKVCVLFVINKWKIKTQTQKLGHSMSKLCRNSVTSASCLKQNLTNQLSSAFSRFFTRPRLCWPALNATHYKCLPSLSSTEFPRWSNMFLCGRPVLPSKAVLILIFLPFFSNPVVPPNAASWRGKIMPQLTYVGSSSSTLTYFWHILSNLVTLFIGWGNIL